MDFLQLAELYEELEKTSSGNKMREILAGFFKKVPAEDIAVVAYLTLGSIAPSSEEVNLGMADKSVLKSLASAGGTDESKVRKLMQEIGDSGLVAEKVLQKKSKTLIETGKLTVQEVFDKLHKIAETSGSGSQDIKSKLLVSVLQKASPLEAKYVCRIALGTLRMGVGDMTILDALAIAYTGEKKNKDILEHAYNICPDVGIVAEILVKRGLKGVEKIDIHVGRPIQMMLAQRVEELAEVPEKMPEGFTAEAKYDGERIQAHKDVKGKITLFSRRLENITHQFPDLVEYLKQGIDAKEFVLEGEVLAIDEKGHHLPFQILMQRRRKHEIEEYIKKIPVQLKCFDILYCNGKSYLQEPYLERKKQLEKIVQKGKHLTLTESITTDDIDEIGEFFQDMLKEKYEGIMIKSHAGEYQAGTRGWNWIKWKKEYNQEMSDTLDLVIVGAYYGKGKRFGNYGALLCAAYDKEKDTFFTVCKLGTGLTDVLLEELPKKLAKHKINHKPARLLIQKIMEPEVWFEPAIVVEVLGAELTISPFHTAGVALRFPRFIKFREEKKPEQATTVKELREMAKR